MKNISTLYIRHETIKEEYRTSLVPNDVEILIKLGYIIYIESNKDKKYKRFFSDEEYTAIGTIITMKKWYEMDNNNLLIIGIKELTDYELSRLDSHSHIYFSHSFKGQKGSEKILNAFKYSNSTLYDFEYIKDDKGKRLLSFCYYAGIVGCHLGILYCDTSINKSTIHIGIIGNGKCSNGVQDVLTALSLPFTIIGRCKKDIDLSSFDILFNCILLEETNTEVWFDNSTVFTKSLLIVDISCDYTKYNNPIKLYDKPTTISSPIHRHGKFVKIIAIENLPSMLPEKSSIFFSEKFRNLLLDQTFKNYMQQCEEEFKKHTV
jgi:saccharopine dehydrogenase (NAD+, L-lysine-forming)